MVRLEHETQRISRTPQLARGPAPARLGLASSRLETTRHSYRPRLFSRLRQRLDQTRRLWKRPSYGSARSSASRRSKTALRGATRLPSELALGGSYRLRLDWRPLDNCQSGCSYQRAVWRQLSPCSYEPPAAPHRLECPKASHQSLPTRRSGCTKMGSRALAGDKKKRRKRAAASSG